MPVIARISLVLLLLALGVGLLVSLVPSTEVEPAVATPAEVVAPRRPAARAERPPAPGRAFGADRPKPNSTAGHIEPLPPADAAVWEQRRAAMEAEWREGLLAAAERFAEARGLSGAQRASVIGALERMHDEVAAVRSELGRGAVLPVEGRKELAEIRSATADALRRELGTEGMLALRAHLAQEVRGAGF